MSRHGRPAILRLATVIHPFPVAAVLLTSALLLRLAHGAPLPMGLFLRAMGVILLSQVTVGALNDFLDREADARWQPHKPIPRGQVRPEAALALATGAGLLFLPVAASFGWIAFLLSLLGLSAGLLYDLRLKSLPWSFLGYVIGFLSLLTWIWLVAGQLRPGFLLVLPAGAALVTAAHLGQSLPDIETDRLQGARGLAVLLGPAAAARAVVVLTGLVAGMALMLAQITGTGWSDLPALAALVITLLGVWLSRGEMTRLRRIWFFRLMTPAIALIALSGAASLHLRGWL